jgi:translation initiation factor IF-3
VDVISATGTKLGVMPLARALRVALKEGLDLVEINANASPPVCKLLDLDKYKYKYEAAKAARRRSEEKDES